MDDFIFVNIPIIRFVKRVVNYKALDQLGQVFGGAFHIEENQT
jgi:hypothetical protein